MTQTSKASVLVVDDDSAICTSITELLGMSGLVAAYAQDVNACLSYLDAHPDVDIVLLDINLGPGISGVDLLPVIKEKHRYVQVIMFTSVDALDAGVECMKRGAFDYMTKPFMEDEFFKRVAGALERKRFTRLNDLYLGILVHDLKNPLQCIMGTLEFFKDTLDSSFQDSHRRMLQVAESGVGQIRGIISNILGIAKFENGSLAPRPAPFDLGKDALPVIDIVRNRGASEPRAWKISLPEPGTFRLCCDRDLYLQVLGNIVSNACRFTPRDGTITVRFVQTKTDECRTSVTNTGSFIPEHLRESIFDKFAGVHLAQDALKGQNFGLGLTFSKMAVEAMGGRMWVAGDAAVPSTSLNFTVRHHKE